MQLILGVPQYFREGRWSKRLLKGWKRGEGVHAVEVACQANMGDSSRCLRPDMERPRILFATGTAAYGRHFIETSMCPALYRLFDDDEPAIYAFVPEDSRGGVVVCACGSNMASAVHRVACRTRRSVVIHYGVWSVPE